MPLRSPGGDCALAGCVNHITCSQIDGAFGIDPYDVCGDGGHPELDRFGQNDFGFATFLPNGTPDLYHINHLVLLAGGH